MALPWGLTPDERKALRRQARRAVGRVAERIHYVLLRSRDYSPTQIADLYQVDERTVTTWLERYQTDGLAGLDDRPRSGRPRVAGAAAAAEAGRCLDQSPSVVGVERTTWTRRLLQRHLGERLACPLSARTVTRLIGRLGFVWSRPKLSLKQGDPAAGTRLAAIAAAIAAAPDAPQLYEDECDLHQLPVVRGQYQRRGEQREITTPGSNRKQPVFGFLNLITGEWHYWLLARKRSVDFLVCLQALYQLYPTGPILLFLDNCSIHTSKLTRRWLAHHPRFQVFYLPAYSGHETNPVEKVWWALKAACAANQMYPSREAIEDAVHAFFSTFTREAALRLVARQASKPTLTVMTTPAVHQWGTAGLPLAA
jgi:transposase